MEAKKFADALAHINHLGDYRMPPAKGCTTASRS
jgi:hypothetical protein